MSDTGSNFEMTGTLPGLELRKRKTPQEKIGIIQQTMEPGMAVSHVARLRCIRKRKLTAVCSHQTRIGNLDAHLI